MSDSDTAEVLLLLTNGGGECTWDAQTSTAAVAKWTAMRAPKWGNCNAHGRCARTGNEPVPPRRGQPPPCRGNGRQKAPQKAPPQSALKKAPAKKHPPSPLCGGAAARAAGKARVPAAHQVPATGLLLWPRPGPSPRC